MFDFDLLDLVMVFAFSVRAALGEIVRLFFLAGVFSVFAPFLSISGACTDFDTVFFFPVVPTLGDFGRPAFVEDDSFLVTAALVMSVACAALVVLALR